MIKLIFMIILFISAGYLISPYITSLVNYFSYGLGQLGNLITQMGTIIAYFLNIISAYNYIMLIIAIFVAIKIFFYIVDTLRGEN